MSVVNNNLLLTADAGVAPNTYQISRSCRFNTADTAFFSRTPTIAGNRKIWTWAGWHKRSDPTDATADTLFSAGTFNNVTALRFADNNTLFLQQLTSGATQSSIYTSQVYRDVSAWCHIVWACDTTQSTAADRWKLYVNGAQITSFSTASYLSQNADTFVNSTNPHEIGSLTWSPRLQYLSGLLAECYLIDGQALTPSSFTETNATTGQLVPKAYGGSYGVNGFRLNFSDNSAATPYTLGADSRTDGALNGNNGTLVNGPTYSSANGGSIVFDGSNDHVTLGTPSALNGVQVPITICMWAKANSFGSFNTLWGVYKSTASNQLYSLLRVEFGRLKYYASTSNGGFQNQGTLAPSTNVWNFYAVTVSGSSSSPSVTIYLNNSSQTFSYSSLSSSPDLTVDFRIGANQGNAASEIWNGNIATVSWYNRALSASEVTQNYNALVGRFGGTSTGSIVTDGMVLNLDAGNTASYPGTGTTWTDISLRKNNWTPNNLSVTAGVGNDSLTDTPTSYGTDTGAGGVVRGNYATLNPLEVPVRGTTTNGNLDYTSTGSNTGLEHRTTTIRNLSSGKWYFECNVTGLSGSADPYIGWVNNNFVINVTNPDGSSNSWAIAGGVSTNNCVIRNGATNTVVFTGAPPYLLMIAIDIDAGKIWFGKDGTWAQSGNPATATNPQFTNLTNGPYSPLFRGTGGSGGTSTLIANFGQRTFAYAAPSGFQALCDTNLPTPPIAKGSSVFDAKLYTGNDGTQSITGFEFSPDLVWLKHRNAAYSHVLHDIIRGTGTTKHLYSSGGEAEGSEPIYNNFVSFDANGFTLGPTSSINSLNENNNPYVTWCWDAGSSTVTNTAGITSQVRANVSAGFSVVTYTGNGVNGATIGHGLGGFTKTNYYQKPRQCR
jgi:hypothetical protein